MKAFAWVLATCLAIRCSHLLAFEHVASPDEIYGVLFEDVQRANVFPDQKTFVDCVPKEDPSKIVAAYAAAKAQAGPPLDLRGFVKEHFLIPETPTVRLPAQEPLEQHIQTLWKLLRREPDRAVRGSSLLPLPSAYIVPGGRFREIYYWDSYFTMLGLHASGEDGMIASMLNNFAYLVNTYGFVPNGNRSYFLSRSQPPFFATMVEFYAEKKGAAVYTTYLPALQAEYDYWMDKSAPTRHVVRMPDGSLLNRYFDQRATARPEAFAKEEELSRRSSQERSILFQNIRAACESGWDFSSRWFAADGTLESTVTTDIVPVDLNCLLYQLELTLAKAYQLSNDTAHAEAMKAAAEERKRAVLQYCWSPAAGFFCDYELTAHRVRDALTLAGLTPLFFKLATDDQARAVKTVVQEQFLKPGGVVTTLVSTGQQWDAPNGWAPLQWMTIRGLENYGHKDLAADIAHRWIALNRSVYSRTGKLMEKYNVVDTSLSAGGGEYPSQDGFGWTNGVLLALLAQYGDKGE